MSFGNKKVRFSGIYPHLAVTNEGHTECGIGAVAAWADKLWFITYPASGYKGDDNKLYSVDGDLVLASAPESVGGTHANRFIHKESGQLIIGLYFIDKKGNVRALDPTETIGRMTATSKHLSDPENKVYFNTMEGGMYEIDVNTLEWRRLRRDMFTEYDNPTIPIDPMEKLPGTHGKGGYSGQGFFYFSNNGNGGVLAEWSGRGDAQMIANWNMIDREKYTEVTGPGGLTGPENESDAIWALGWDRKSALINMRYEGKWQRYRIPKASYTQDADHGWYTEWPRIRKLKDVGYLMCEHGMLYQFPGNFSPRTTAGIRPISRHQKMIADYESWNGEIVFACDDASMFDNPTLGRQQSNLWFAGMEDLRRLGKPAGWCGIWQHETLMGGVASEPVLFAGFDQRVLHIRHGHFVPVCYQIEADTYGDGNWRVVGSVNVPPHRYAYSIFPAGMKAEWIRVRPLNDAIDCSASIDYLPSCHAGQDKALVAGIAHAGEKRKAALLHVAEGEDMKLQLADESGYYEIGGDLALCRVEDGAAEKQVREIAKLSADYTVDKASVLFIDEQGNRYRLPKGDPAVAGQSERGIREVVTERYLINACGTIYELPRKESGGFQRVKPITTHNLHIHDFASWRGMLAISGVNPASAGEHCILSNDGKTGIWLGNVDDLWNFGAPGGTGGPCYDTPMTAGIPSDPYLMACYIEKSVDLSHDDGSAVTFTIQVDFQADGTWSDYANITVPCGQTVRHDFPEGYSAHWVRIRVDRSCKATALFTYK